MPINTTEAGGNSPKNSKMHYALWALQGLLAILFLFAGGAKLAIPMAELAKQTPLPGPFLKFIGVAEIVGAIGLILPGLLRIQEYLTPLAAACLEVIIIGAVVTTVVAQGVGPAILPFVTGLLLPVVIYGRWSGRGSSTS